MSEREKPTDPKPYYEAHVFCCTNRRPAGHPRGCCAEKGGEALRDHMKARAKALGLKNVRINNAGCLDRCELGPNRGDLSRRRLVSLRRPRKTSTRCCRSTWSKAAASSG